MQSRRGAGNEPAILRYATFAAIAGIAVGIFLAGWGATAALEDRSAWPTATASFDSAQLVGSYWVYTYRYDLPDGTPTTIETRSKYWKEPPATLEVRWRPGQPFVREPVVDAGIEFGNAAMGLVVAAGSAIALVLTLRIRRFWRRLLAPPA